MAFPSSAQEMAPTCWNSTMGTCRQTDDCDCESAVNTPIEPSPLSTYGKGAAPANLDAPTPTRAFPPEFTLIPEPMSETTRCESAESSTAAKRFVAADSEQKVLPHRHAHLKIALRYAIAAAGCVLFALIYAQFSHEVHSPFMTFMFGIPLIGGALPALCLALSNAKPLPRTTRQSWALALAALTVASCLRGIFDIAGTASPYLVAYLVFAVICAIAATVTCARKRHAQSDPNDRRA